MPDLSYAVEQGNDTETRKDILKNIGSLKVVLWECKITGSLPVKPFRKPSGTSSILKPILEENLKGRRIEHRTCYGVPSYRQSQVLKTERVEPPLATFIFKYSSKESLRAQRIIPARTPVEEMSIERMRQELRRRREEMDVAEEEEERRRKVKREVKQELGRPGPIIPPGWAR